MHRTPIMCSALVLVAIASSPATACPWNGCGTDAAKSAQSKTYYPSLSYAYAAPVYGYIATPTKPVRYYRKAPKAK